MRSKLALILTALPGTAAAQQWAPGPGCEGILTVQSQGCYVANFWTCAEAPEGYVYRAVHEYGEPLIADIFDGDFNWISTEFSDGWREVLVHPVRDPISLSELVETGFNTLDFDMLSNPASPDDAVKKVRVRGADVMLGETVEIDGERLDKSQYMVTFAGADDAVYAAKARFRTAGSGSPASQTATPIETVCGAPATQTPSSTAMRSRSATCKARARPSPDR